MIFPSRIAPSPASQSCLELPSPADRTAHIRTLGWEWGQVALVLLPPPHPPHRASFASVGHSVRLEASMDLGLGTPLSLALCSLHAPASPIQHSQAAEAGREDG